MLLLYEGLYKIYQRFNTEQYYEKSSKIHQKITVMGSFFSTYAGCDLIEKRTSSQFLSSECFVKFFRLAFL